MVREGLITPGSLRAGRTEALGSGHSQVMGEFVGVGASGEINRVLQRDEPVHLPQIVGMAHGSDSRARSPSTWPNFDGVSGRSHEMACGSPRRLGLSGHGRSVRKRSVSLDGAASPTAGSERYRMDV